MCLTTKNKGVRTRHDDVLRLFSPRWLGLLFGLDIGVLLRVPYPLLPMSSRFPAHTQEWVVSSMMFGAAVGAVGERLALFQTGPERA